MWVLTCSSLGEVNGAERTFFVPTLVGLWSQKLEGNVFETLFIRIVSAAPRETQNDSGFMNEMFVCL